MNNLYREDILKDNFEQRTITLKDDYEGKAIATLIRRLPDLQSSKAVLYIHGFNDYFFQAEMGVQFNKNGFNFYALDLRKYGRSHLSHQKLNDIRDLKTYYEEIKRALDIIHEEGNNEVILFGHSTGGLILTLFAKDFSNDQLFDGLILNSPFYELNERKLVKMLLPVVSFLGRLMPSITIAGGFSEEYGKSIHKLYSGEWDYNLEWKPILAPKINLGWLRAIYKAQTRLKKHFQIKKPVLILHSKKSITDIKDKRQVQTSDTILNVKDIDRVARNIQGNVDIISIDGGLHDLILSQKAVRENVYTTIFDWVKKYGSEG
ncbi:MAG: alpha/beta hydrolase [Dysgonomonas sp.]